MMVQYSYVIKRLFTHDGDPTKESWYFLSGYNRLTGPSWSDDFRCAKILPEYEVFKLRDRIADKDRMCDACRRRTLIAVRIDKVLEEKPSGD